MINRPNNFKRLTFLAALSAVGALAAFALAHLQRAAQRNELVSTAQTRAPNRPEHLTELSPPPAKSGETAPSVPAAQPTPATPASTASPQTTASPNHSPQDTGEIPEPPPGALSGSLVLHFNSDEELLAFVKEAQSRGISILGILGELKAVRIGLRGDSSDAEILALAKGRAQPGFDFPVFPPTPLPAEGDSGAAAFGGGALSWIGVPEANLDWGKGVTLAVLDSPLAAGALKDANIERVQPDASGMDPELTDHGTTVSSLIVGQEGQARGIAPSTHLVHIDVMESGKNGSTFELAQGILEAIDRGAEVISISLATTGDSRVLREAVRQATAKGIAVVAAAGNEAVQSIPFPAAYESVVTVGAVDAAGKRATFSNTGPQVDIAAPGVGMTASAGPDRVGIASGTSLSTPLVAGMIAKVLSDDRSLTPRQAAEIVMRYADDAGLPGFDEGFGMGILNANRILERDTRGIRDAAIADHWLTEDTRGNFELIVSVQNRGTESLAGVYLTIQVGEVSRNAALGTLAPNEVASAQISIQKAAAQSPSGLLVESEVSAGSDDAPQNNTKRTVVRAK